MRPIFHIATAADWAAAQEAGAYTTSTRGRTLAEVGFIHCSRGDQWPRVRDALYGDVTEPLLLLEVDTDLLDVPVVEEPGEPGSSETFPHVYGPLPVEAVVKAIPLSRDPRPPEGGATHAGSAPAGSAPAGPAPGQSFTAIFFREMFRNAAIASLVLVAGAVGLAVGATMGDAVAPALGGLVGLLVGGVAGRILYLRGSR